MELEMDCLTLRRLLQKVCSYKCQFCTNVCYEHLPVFKAGLSSSYDGWAKCKEIVPNVLDPNQDVQKHATPNSSLHKLKIYSSKGCRKTSQR